MCIAMCCSVLQRVTLIFPHVHVYEHAAEMPNLLLEISRIHAQTYVSFAEIGGSSA